MSNFHFSSYYGTFVLGKKYPFFKCTSSAFLSYLCMYVVYVCMIVHIISSFVHISKINVTSKPTQPNPTQRANQPSHKKHAPPPSFHWVPLQLASEPHQSKLTFTLFFSFSILVLSGEARLPNYGRFLAPGGPQIF